MVATPQKLKISGRLRRDCIGEGVAIFKELRLESQRSTD
jgi:hypothetical protein